MKSWSKFFDATYVINLESRKDRWESITNFASAAGLPIKKLTAFPASDVDMNMHRYGTRTRNAAAIACSLSHIKLFREAISKGYKKVFVLEDDAMFDSDLYEQLDRIYERNQEILEDFDVLYLGAGSKYPPVILNEDLALSQYTLLTHAYIISERGMLRMLEFVDLMYDGKMPYTIDVFFATDLQPFNQTYQLNEFIVKIITSYSDLAFLKRNWETISYECIDQGLENPAKWNYFIDRAKKFSSYPQKYGKMSERKRLKEERMKQLSEITNVKKT